MKYLSHPRVVFVAFLAWLGGCAGASTKGPTIHEPAAFQRESLEPFHCDVLNVTDDEERARDQASRGRALELELNADHARFYRYTSPADDALFATIGEPCGAAHDKARCEAELTAAERSAQTKPQVFAITTADDTVRLYQGVEVLSLLGRIDNPDKAWLALMIREDVSWYFCEDASWHGYRRTERGYTVGWGDTRSSCPFERVQVVDHIDEAGNVTRLREGVVESHPGRCLKDANGRPGQEPEPSEPTQMMR